MTAKAKTSVRVEMIREMVFTTHIASDKDGSLKIIQFDEFTDSKTYLDFCKALAAAKANRESASSVAPPPPPPTRGILSKCKMYDN